MPKIAQGELHRRSAKRETAVENMTKNALQSTSNEDTAAKDITEKDSVRKPKKTKQSEQTLDTSQLLQKKDDRRI